MKLSAFTVVRNAINFDYPVVESINSVLPIVDEYVVALGDSCDNTTELVRSIENPRLKFLERVWEPSLFNRGAILAHETTAALDHCTGDWCIYLQADEVVHEKYLRVIVEAARKYLHDERVEGFVLSFKHFWGDYNHYQKMRNWYRREIRIVRNKIGVRSWKDAQSFRINGRKMNVVQIPAEVYHYGWVRDPHSIKIKSIAMDSLYHDEDWIERRYEGKSREKPFEYGSRKNLAVFTGTPPKVMKRRIASMHWQIDEVPHIKHEHDRLSVRILSAVENFLGTRFGEYRNFKLIGVDDELSIHIGN
ncbi:MAG: glycosyltransferase [Candidatus Glassbacteria bacterium]